MGASPSNCTLPLEGTQFVSSPHVRGTLDILWSCSTVLILRTWSVLHLNVPLQSTPQNKRQNYIRAARRFFSKVKWMVFNLLAPEWTLAKAWADYRSVQFIEYQYKRFQEIDGVPCSRSHIHFANMGGFVIKFSPTETPLPPQMDNIVMISSDPQCSSDAFSRCAPSSSNLDCSNGSSIHQLGSLHENPCFVGQPTWSSVTERTGYHHGVYGDNDLDSIQLGPESKASSKKYSRSIGDPVRNVLEGWGFHLPGDEVQKSVEKLERAIGPVDWKTDPFNSVSSAEAYNYVLEDRPPCTDRTGRFSRVWGSWRQNLGFLQGNVWVLNAAHLLVARQLRIIERLPCISVDNLGDHSKADAFVKLIGLTQMLWFFIQLGARFSQHLPISRLEIMTLAFAISTVFIYIILLDMPKDVQLSLTLTADRYGTAQDLNRIAFWGPVGPVVGRGDISIPNHVLHATRKNGEQFVLGNGASFSVLILGAVHCLAWDFVFPTDLERNLWQISSIVTAAAIPVLYVTHYLRNKAVMFISNVFVEASLRNYAGMFPNTVIFLMFLAARVFTLVEVFRSLAFLPPEAFSATWSGNLPHIG
ncbi:hypothetical protein BDV25DRAFT_135746 [Aspergillus avenaceus]|uniref:Uncharacterized protein n=1 Tax=Aspergillus avenaceus TaxID=36643 RepID=A0A5N6U7J4_ASPAV|nr:hypothetical protein BDV25DRAFT_135746 [Aspergillus avenaceus]